MSNKSAASHYTHSFTNRQKLF